MNTYTLIKTADNHYILTSDEDINESIDSIWYGVGEDNSVIRRKAYTNITFTDEVALEIGYVDMLKKCNEIYDMHPNNIELYGDSESKNTYQAGVVDGYLQAKEDNKDKVYTLRDLRNAYEEGLSEGYEREELSYETPMLIDMYADKVRKDKTQWQVEIEMENYSKPEDGHSAVHKDTRPKITNNSINVIAIK